MLLCPLVTVALRPEWYGDESALEVLAKHFKVNVLIARNWGEDTEATTYPYQKAFLLPLCYPRTIVLRLTEQMDQQQHYDVIAVHDSDGITSVFDTCNLPREIVTMFDLGIGPAH